MDDRMIGIVGGIVGSAIGIAGGIFGTWMSIRNTRSVEERRFITRWSLIFWISCSAFLALLFLLPSPYRWYLWIPYGPLLAWGIIACNKGQARIRAQQEQGHPQT